MIYIHANLLSLYIIDSQTQIYFYKAIFTLSLNFFLLFLLIKINIAGNSIQLIYHSYPFVLAFNLINYNMRLCYPNMGLNYQYNHNMVL